MPDGADSDSDPAVMVAKMAKTKAAPAELPADLLPHWDREADEPHRPTPYDLEDDGDMASVKAALAALDQWRHAREDASEAPARQAYAEKVASHLVGVFPGARVNVPAYVAAAGEDLAGFSLDVLKLVGQRARRTLKALPPIAVLVEMAEAEESRRRRQADAYRSALAAHAAAIARGKAEAEAIAASPACAISDPAAILRLYELITFHPLGIASPYADNDARQAAATVLRLLRDGDAATSDSAIEVLDLDREKTAELAELEGEPRDVCDACWCRWERRIDAALASLAEAAGVEWRP